MRLHKVEHGGIRVFAPLDGQLDCAGGNLFAERVAGDGNRAVVRVKTQHGAAVDRPFKLARRDGVAGRAVVGGNVGDERTAARGENAVVHGQLNALLGLVLTAVRARPRIDKAAVLALCVGLSGRRIVRRVFNLRMRNPADERRGAQHERKDGGKGFVPVTGEEHQKR